jgi:hypothetical protein
MYPGVDSEVRIAMESIPAGLTIRASAFMEMKASEEAG